MNELECRGLFEEVRDNLCTLFPEHKTAIHEYRLEFNNGKRMLGNCSYKEKRIKVSRWHLKGSSEENIEDTLRHEFAHAIAYMEHGAKAWNHGALWSAVARVCGANPSSTNDAFDVEKPPSKYTLVCEGCGETYARHRMPRGAKYGCGKCGTTLQVKKHW